MAGSTGVLVPPVGYLEKLREITAKHGILLIFDEVITAYGRLGEATAALLRRHAGPDHHGQGRSNAAIPAGAVAVKREVHDAIVNTPQGGIEFFHGYTYSAHLLPPPPSWRRWTSIDATTCSAAPASRPAPSRKPRIRSGAPHVIDVRNIGLVAGIELARAPARPARAPEVFQKCFDSGLMVCYTGDIIAVSPPLIIDEAQIGQIFDQIGKVLKEVAALARATVPT